MARREGADRMPVDAGMSEAGRPEAGRPEAGMPVEIISEEVWWLEPVSSAPRVAGAPESGGWLGEERRFGGRGRSAGRGVMGGRERGMAQGAGRARTGANRGTERLARGLGWFGIGLGLAELVAPGRLARLIGVRESEANLNLLRAFGLREMGSGAGILARPDASTWVWSRVAGDALDLAALGRAYQSEDSDQRRVLAAAAAVLGVTVLDVLCAQRLSRESNGAGGASAMAPAQQGTHVRHAVTVGRSPEEVYAFWRDFRNLPQFMEHLEAVTVLDERRSHWVAKAPAGRTVEWDAEIVAEEPGLLIAWRSLEGADVPNQGAVRFTRAPGDRGTEVTVDLRYDAPGGALGTAIAKLFGEEPGLQVERDLQRFKQVMETGEVVRSDASIHRGMHAARPPEQPFDPASEPYR